MSAAPGRPQASSHRSAQGDGTLLSPIFSRVLLHSTMAAAIAAGAIALYHHTIVRPALAIGMVDVAEVYRIKEAEFTQLLTRSSSDDDRQRALSMARAFAQRLPAALEELPRECACLVLIKNAVAGSTRHMVDLTPALRGKLEAP